ncbi:MAG: hypothetical protein RSC41_03355, partial [Oscillospiraceae bacterium]
AATMVAGMAVSAFAYVDANNTTPVYAKGVTDVVDAGEDYTFKKATDGTTDGGKVYFPILVGDEIVDDKMAGDTTDANNVYFYANKASEVEDLTARVKVLVGKEYVEKEAKIVRKDKQITPETAKVYAVEVKFADFNLTSQKEIEVEVTLYNKGKKQGTVKKFYEFGSDAYKINLNDNGEYKPSYTGANKTTVKAALAGSVAKDAYKGLYKVKIKNNDLSMNVLAGADAVVLEEVIDADGNAQNVETISLDFVDANASFDVAASKQGDLFLGYSTDANKAVVLANQDAEVSFLDFDANPEFDFNGTLRLYVDDIEKTYFCYELVDGKLVAAGKYNADDECFEIKANKLTSYVLSDKELVNPTTPEEEKPAVEAPVEDDKIVGTGAIA